jgi:hypothetical protein
MTPVVKVPVLSEHRTDMQPRVSMVAKFFTKTLRFAIRLAMIVSDRATQRGRPCSTASQEKRPTEAGIGRRT